MNNATQSKNLVAKLLANEDLRVVRAPVETASFNVKERVLTLPQWQNMTTDVEDMLIGHEVGHALFTPTSYHESDDHSSIFEYMNVIEDVRIEKAMKRKYPGMRASFTAGYNELRQKDFFGIANRDLSTAILIDRINLYFKCGYNCGVKFTAEEMNLVRRVDQCKTVDDVRALAREIYDYSKGKLEETKELKQATMDEISNEMNQEVESFGEEMDTEYDSLEDDFDDEIDGQNARSKAPEFDDEEDYSMDEYDETGESSEPVVEDDEQLLKPKTQTVFDDRMKELADNESRYEYFDTSYARYYQDDEVVIGYKRIINEIMEDTGGYLRPHIYQQFKRENSRIINYLIKEFEMRKAATEYQRSLESPTGQLDSRKLATYKLNKDIFRKITEVAEGQQHGMIMLVDWSGSMVDCIDDVLKQSIILATFCRQAEIPFKVMAFTNGYPTRTRYNILENLSDAEREDFLAKKSWSLDEFHLLELLTHKMSNTDFSRMCEILLDQPYRRSRRYQMYSTPLNEALVYLTSYIGVFMKENSVEKMSLITLTDGESHAISYGAAHNRLRPYERTYANGGMKATKVYNYIEDEITKITYPLSTDGCEQTDTFLKMIKDRYKCKLIGFYIGSTGSRHINTFLRSNCGLEYHEAYVKVNEVRSEGRKNGVAICPPGARDKMYWIPQNKLRIDDEELVADPKMSVNQLARSFGKHLKIQKTNRVLLNNFIGEIA